MDHPAASPMLRTTVPRLGRQAGTLPPWLVLACALTLVDAAATALWLELGIAVEGNPVLAGLVEVVGALPAMALRGAVGIALLVALAALRDRSRLARGALPVVTAVLAGVAVWHVVGAVLAA